ncbi:ATP-binding protein [Xanthomarina gelatinilytica]|uniref:ATP-binding protein n=1 Tax=Xanthomarina gelatinilytica TaxID=1137281 RepID=UPI003AA97F22
MKLSKKIETEIWQVYETWLNSYLNGDVETYDSFLDDDYHFIGSATKEEFLNRKDTTKFFADTGDQFAGKTEIRNESKIIEQFGELIFITHVLDGWFLHKNDWNFYSRFRFSSILRKNNDGWRFIYQHFSIPDPKTAEGETIGYDKINEENQELREAIKRRTFELEQKNRELEVETALEKVRARTMAMQHSDELQETSFLLDQQVRELGLKTWGCAFNIYGENESTEWFGNEAGVLPTYTVPRKGIFKKYYQKGQKGESLFIQEFSGKACIDHYEYMSTLPVIGDVLKTLKKTNNGFPTYQIDHVFYFKYGYLLFITREHVPDSYNIFKRFAKVFEQTYTRFLDLQKAEAQAREAQIEAALERTRTQSMLMQHSEELDATSRVFHQQLLVLGIDTEFSYVWLPDEAKNEHQFWVAWNSEQNKEDINSKAIVYPLDKTEPYTASCFKDWASGIPINIHHVEPKEVKTFFNAWEELLKDAKKLTPKYFSNGLYYAEAFMKYGCFGINIKRPINDEEKQILQRFSIEFERTYTRFLDLQKAEAQAREAQIETALEKVRSRTMAMQSSSELPEAANNLFLQIQGLGIPAWSTGYCIWEDNQKSAWCNMSSKGEIQKGFSLPTIGEGYNFKKPLKNNEPFHVAELGGKELVEHYNFMKTLPGIGEVLEDFAKKGISLPTFQIFHIVYFSHGYLMFITYEAVPNDWEVFKRFGKVFQQTFTRFLDLKKAEAQARESQIEAALEKVRSRSLAMHNTNELSEVVAVVAEKLKELGVIFDAGGVILCTYFPDNKDVVHWIAVDDFSTSGRYYVPYFDNPIFNEAWASKIRGDTYFSKEFPIEAKNDFFKQAFELSDYSKMPEDYKQFVLHAEKHTLSAAWSKNSAIIIPSLTGAVPSESDAEIIKRFAKVFEQAYIRFMDLQKAEEQARESLIEIGLERVRSRTLAMQTSEELAETAVVLFKQLIDLGIAPNRLFIGIVKDEGNSIEAWATNEDGSSIANRFTLQASKNKSIKKMLTGWKQQKKSLVFDIKGKELQDYFQYLNKEIKIPFMYGLDQKRRVQTIAYFSGGLIGMASPNEQSEESIHLLERFASVFNLTYTRFNDLKVAEARAREAQIEASLEKVRSVALSLQKADEMLNIAKVLYEQLLGLGFTKIRNAIIDIHNDDEETFLDYDYSHDMSSAITKFSFYGDPVIEQQVKKVQSSNDAFFEIELKGKQLEELIETRLRNGEKDDPRLHKADLLTYNLYSFGNGAIGISNFGILSDEQKQILKKFRNVFTFAYKRYTDLAKTEAQAREAKIEAALEKVRSVALSMAESTDLLLIAKALYEQLLELGFNDIRNAIIDVNNEDDKTFMDYDYSHEMGGAITPMSYDDDPTLVEQVQDIAATTDGVSEMTLEGQQLQDLIEMRRKNGEADDPRLLKTDSICYTLYAFGNGAIGISNFGELNKDQKNILNRFRIVFTFAYQRFKDLQEKEEHSVALLEEKQRLEKTLSDLQTTQTQLIQSEKMASLGELTAGIAHEIQNPLNFVNNFSEVSQELLDEIQEELENGNLKEVKEIMKDVIQNLEKINHHGKRADGIVKGMLQHSRSSTGTKEPTNINVLADEYLRLAYHGLRAKDKSFNATLETRFDEGLGNINIIPQDIGRVVLNLLTNAFYAVNEKSSLNKDLSGSKNLKGLENYQPTVSLTTKKQGNWVTVSVKDNGNGIPQKVLVKIFQPFFTTKPTGQGTGLGLSMSYDIVTKGHGGELIVETEQGKGTEFTIKLPITD